MKSFLLTAGLLTSCSGATLAGRSVAPDSQKSGSRDSNSEAMPYSGQVDPNAPAPSDAKVPQSSSPAGEETANIPKPINGAYLHCATISELGTRIDLGCHMKESDGRVIESSRLGSSVSYSREATAVDEVTASMTIKSHPDRLFDAIFHFDSSNIDSTRSAVTRSRITVRIESPSYNLPRLYSGLISEILESTNTGRNFKIYGGNETKIVFDTITGASFFRHDQNNRDWNEALMDCKDSKMNGWKDWAVPDYETLQYAHAHGLARDMQAAEALQLNRYPLAWIYAIPTSTPSDAYYLVSELTDPFQAIQTLPKSTLLGPALCQR